MSERRPRIFFDWNPKAPEPLWRIAGFQIQWLRRIVVKASVEWR